MNIKRWIALALIATLLIAALGFISYRVLASANTSGTSQDCTPEVQENESSEAPDTAEDATDDCNQEGEDENGGQAAPAGNYITAEEAQAIAEGANPGATALHVEFEREGGKEFWEVELDNGIEVMVDATSGQILGTE